MLFRRRSPAALSEHLRVMLWPRRSFRRSAKYYAKRALRLNGTPHAIAAGIAAGVFVSWLPVPGFHFILAAAVAWILAGNLVASAIGTAFGNPLTFPFIWGSTYEIGQLVLRGRSPDVIEPLHLGSMLGHVSLSSIWEPLLKPMMVGSLPLGLFFGLVFYFLTYWGAVAFRNRRRMRLALTRERRSGASGMGASTQP